MKQNSQFLRDQIILKHYGQFELGPPANIKEHSECHAFFPVNVSSNLYFKNNIDS